MDGCCEFKNQGVDGHAFAFPSPRPRDESPRRQWFGARGGDGHAPSLPRPSPPKPNLTVARHLRARNLPHPFAPPPPTTSHPGDKALSGCSAKNPIFSAQETPGGKAGPHSGAAGPMGSGE
ncbi:hypothetical protein SEVIR_5G144850v4 [Setaria viridis]